MKCNGATHEPLKTRDIANGCELSIHLTCQCLWELGRQYIVESGNYGKGYATYWYLVD